MAATQIFVLPTAVLSIGQHGPFISPVMGALYTSYEFHITPGLGWPATGGPVMELTVEVSHDGGVTWLFDASTDFGPTANWGNPSLGVFRVSIGSAQGQVLNMALTDLYRFTLNVLQACGAPVFTVYGSI